MATYIPESRLESLSTRSRLLTDSSASISYTQQSFCSIYPVLSIQHSQKVSRKMWFQPFLMAVVLARAALSDPDPGLLRVPKVYNAVITSNQNLAPSRAYPVIQPVVHRTAIGYVPPFYYTQIAPGFAGPGVVQLDPGPPSRPEDAESVETPSNGETKSSGSTKSSRPSLSRSENEEFSGEDLGESSEKGSVPSSDKKNGKKNNDDRVPLNFYPNYRSVYYGPYFNPYNAFPPNLASPGTYYVDYPQPPLLGPLPPPIPLQPGPGIVPIIPERPNTSPNDDNDRESPKRNSQKQKARTSERREKIPDVPPPPPPISTGKKTS